MWEIKKEQIPQAKETFTQIWNDCTFNQGTRPDNWRDLFEDAWSAYKQYYNSDQTDQYCQEVINTLTGLYENKYNNDFAGKLLSNLVWVLDGGTL